MKKIIIAAAALAAATTATSASAQASRAVANANANARLLSPLALESRRGINFGDIVMVNVTGDQTVSLDRLNGDIVCGTGGALTCSGTRTTGEFRITGTQGQTVNVSLSQPSFALSGSNGGSLVFTPTIPATVALGAPGPNANLFTVGGSFVIGTSTRDGLYSGQIEVQVQYQ